MLSMPPPTSCDDPRRLRELVERVAVLAQEHSLTSVIVGLAGREGDPDFPGVVDFVESELRVEDSIFRMTRERVVLFVADVSRDAAAEIMGRILQGYHERSSQLEEPAVALRYFEVTPRTPDVTVKQVLPTLFGPSRTTH